MYRTILRNNIKVEILNKENIEDISPSKTDLFMHINNMYFGTRLEQFIADNVDIDPNELHKFKTNALAFYIELCTQIRKRFPSKDPLLYFNQNGDC